MSASQPPSLSKQDATFSKNRYVQIQFVTIHLFQSPILWDFYKATLEMSFDGALCCGASAKAGAGSSLYLSKTPVVRDLKFWLLTACISSPVCSDLVTFSGVKKGFAIPASSRFEHSIAFCWTLPLQSFSLAAVGNGWGREGGKRQSHTQSITHTFHQDTSLWGMQPGQDLGRTEPLERYANMTWERRESLPYHPHLPQLAFKTGGKTSKTRHFNLFLLF